MKKTVSLFLALLIALSGLLTGCGETAEQSADEGPSSPEVSATPGAEDLPEEALETEAGLTKDDLPDDLDFGGETITIHIRNGDNYNF